MVHDKMKKGPTNNSWAWWYKSVIPASLEVRQENCSSPGVWGQPGQFNETLPKIVVVIVIIIIAFLHYQKSSII
jgi:hypothetical protein